MKLIIQIPCYNEEEVLPTTLSCLPREVEGVDTVEWLVIDDGSEDNTVQIARDHGVDHVVKLPRHMGLAQAFAVGLESSIKTGADVVVNTDGDNQYDARDIPRLIQPLVRDEADIVVGARPIKQIEHFSRRKKWLQRLGSWMVRMISGTDVRDAPSGFRALTRDAALRLNVFDDYTYTVETLIQAGRDGLRVTSVPIRTNEDRRPSRLVRGIGSYVLRSMRTMVVTFLVYRPLQFFTVIGSIPLLLGGLLCVRWLLLHFLGDPTRARAPSLIAAAILILIGFHLWVLGLLASLMSTNRQLIQDVSHRIRRHEYTDEE